jgi:hypothetical protein
VDWLGTYQARQKSDGPGDPFGASRNKRRVMHVEEEESAAVGTGDAAIVAAAAAAGASREEGRRYDYLLKTGIDALVQACRLHEQMCATLLQRQIANDKVHVELLQSVRSHFLARVDAEGEAAQLAREMENEKGDTISKMVEQVAPMLAAQLFAGGADKPPTPSK